MKFTLKKQPKISVIGAGYVGLYAAVGFASQGYSVLTSDVDAEKAKKINQGIPPFHEPGLREKLKDCIQRGTLKCLVNLTEKAFSAIINICICSMKIENESLY